MAGMGLMAGRDGIMLTSISLMLYGTCVAVGDDRVYDITRVSEVGAYPLSRVKEGSGKYQRVWKMMRKSSRGNGKVKVI
jgi:hypothetical protein